MSGLLYRCQRLTDGVACTFVIAVFKSVHVWESLNVINKHLNRVVKIFRKDTAFLFSP